MKAVVGPVVALLACGPLPAVIGAQADTKNSSSERGIEWIIPAEEAAFGAQLKSYVSDGQSTVKSFFGEDFPERFTVRVAASRAAFDDFFRTKWNIPKTECWWVAAGVADTFIILSPSVWRKEACEHNPDDADHVKGIVAHEIVHVFHGQHNPGMEELEEIGWFIEGLAVYVSGQLDGQHGSAARKAIEPGAAPITLATAWSGPHRYGVSGSLVKYIDVKFGRSVTKELLTARTQDAVLKRLGLTEDELLAAWRAFVMAADGQDR